jgi:hypothetical protein
MTKFYLGRQVDPESQETTDIRFHYDPDDLTTHGFVVGMTGSGKTGLCIGVLEEAALASIPALMIDLKGDITNALLHFPDLAPADFQPWIDPEAARRDGQTPEQAAAKTADLWRNGLADWGLGPENIQALADSAGFSVYTPGSDAGVPVNILASFAAPDVAWEDHQEIMRERIGGIATALLGLVGEQDVDPVRSREHILLSNIFEHAWSRGQDLDLGALIMQVQNPPFDRLGVLDLERFFPEKDRFDLAMLLNNILASPGFQTWLQGDPLNIEKLRFTHDGKPRHNIFYLAHLSEEERMFFVTLLFSAVETWMRSQPGAGTLRMLLYFDEIFGYLPAGSRNPPSKIPMLRMLKQARAFGVGLLLATQNPVDLDYKALSNIGTWFIGRLQTDRDRERLLDGLEGAAPGLDRRSAEDMITALGKRIFLAHNVHETGPPQLFRTRWVMNYLAGPLSRAQVETLTATGVYEPVETASAAAAAPMAEVQESPPAEVGPELPGSEIRPTVPARAEEYFLPLTQPAPEGQLGVLYRPYLLAQAEVRFVNRKYGLEHGRERASLVFEVDRSGLARWEEFLFEPLDGRSLAGAPAAQARWAALEGPFAESTALTKFKSDFVDWLYRGETLKLRANEKLDVYGAPDEPEEAFRGRCIAAAQSKRDAELEKARDKAEKTMARLRDKLSREERELENDKKVLQSRKLEEYGTHAENIIGLFSKRTRRRMSSSLSKRRMTQQAIESVEESEAEIASLTKQIEQAEQGKAETLAEIKARWEDVISNTSEIEVHPLKKDIRVIYFGIAWSPYYLVEAGGRIDESAAYGE